LILHIDTSTRVCSVALSEKKKILSYRQDTEGKNHALLLTTFIDEVLQEGGIRPEELKAIAISMGPGSYTGLRIGVSTAKGMAYALNIPMISVETLKIIAQGILNTQHSWSEEPDFLICPMIDARRMEVYSALYSSNNLKLIRKVQADIIDEYSYADFLKQTKILFCGDGAPKCKNIIHHTNAFFNEEYVISAKDMVKIAYSKFVKDDFVDTAYFEPFYLKDFIATIPKKKIL